MLIYRKFPTFPVILGILVSLLLWQSEVIYSKGDRFLGKTITRIDIEGNENVTDNEILEMITIRPGKILNAADLDQDIKTIFKHEFIKNVRVEGEDYKDGVKVIIIVEERPVVTKIILNGVEELTDNELTDVIPLKRDKVFEEQVMMRSVDIINQVYRSKGYFNTSVRVTREKDKETKNGVTVIFTIDEGEEIVVAKINIMGTSAIEPEELYKQMEVEEKNFFNHASFSVNKFEQDKERIILYYRSKGYLDAHLVEASWDVRWKNPEKKDERIIVVNYKVNEGDQYFFAGYDIEWDSQSINDELQKPFFTKKEIFDKLELTNNDVGKYFNDMKYMSDRSVINLLYSEKGYIFVRIVSNQTTFPLTPEELEKLENTPIQKAYRKEGKDYYNIDELKKVYEKEPEKRGRNFVHTKMVVYEGTKGYIENIIIKGNEKTQDKVIRREFLIKPGELFNARLVQRSREKIYNLGFFRAVNLNARPGSQPGTMNLLIDVEEQLTGTLSLGGGFSSLTGFSIFSEITENNLNGSGQRLRGKFQFGLNEVGVESSWTEPWIFNVPWSLTITGFYRHLKRFSTSIGIVNDQYTQTYYYYDSTGVEFRLGHRLGINWVHYHSFSPIFSKVTDPSSLATDSAFILEARGWQLQNKLRNGITFDNRDNVFNPTQGMEFNFYVDLVGSVLAGDDHFNRYAATFTYYWWPTDYTIGNLFRNNALRAYRIVLEHRISMAFTQQTNPVYDSQDKYLDPYVENYDRLWVGGPESLRGWLPLNDSLYPTGWQDGASHRILFSTELRFPVDPNLMWVVMFFDAGALFNDLNQYYIDRTTPDSYVQAITDTELNTQNLFDLNYYVYSWGFGLRINVAMMPLRFYLAQRLYWDSNKGGFYPPPEKSNFEFVFGIGDQRF